MMRFAIPSDIERQEFDLVVVGAGINGAAIARDAVIRGLRTLLLDKGDVASGTTSWSSRLIHGGLRYLEHGEVRLVRESLRERERLLRNAPHLVEPMRMVIPMYEGNRRRPAVIRAGMLAYDLLSVDKSLPRHQVWSASKARRQIPGLNPCDLRGAALYYDAQATFAERLAVENVVSAAEHGATVATYARVDRLVQDGDRVRGLIVADVLGGGDFYISSRVVVNVAGPWVDQVLAGTEHAMPRLIGGTKGSHLVVDPFPGAPPTALHYEAREDHRAVLVIPWNGRYLIGSTDIRYEGDLDDVWTDEAEVDYLLHETNQIIPGADLTRANVRYAYAGVRPLPYQRDGSEAEISRDHAVVNHAPALRGLLSITGGKLTTFRALAEHTVDAVYRQLGKTPPRCETARLPLPGGAGVSLPAFRRSLAVRSGLPMESVDRLVTVYGARAPDVLSLADRDPTLREPFCAATGSIGAEVVFSVEREFARTLEDVMMRRTMVGLEPEHGVGADEVAAAIAQRHLGWDEARAHDEVLRYRAYLERFVPQASNPPH
jgi:glycerol-3-phosphate dehydrogenase